MHGSVISEERYCNMLYFNYSKILNLMVIQQHRSMTFLEVISVTYAEGQISFTHFPSIVFGND